LLFGVGTYGAAVTFACGGKEMEALRNFADICSMCIGPLPGEQFASLWLYAISLSSQLCGPQCICFNAADCLAKAFNTYIAPQAAYRSCSGAFVLQTERAYSLQAVG